MKKNLKKMLHPGLNVFWINKGNLTPVPEDHFGSFCTGYCYVIVYGPNDGETVSPTCYFYIGSQSSIEDATNAAQKALSFGEVFGQPAVQIRLTMGYEIPEFRNLFERITIFDGVELPDLSKPQTRLFEILSHSCVIQRPIDSKAFDISSVLVLLNNNEVFLWHGPQSRDRDRMSGSCFVDYLRKIKSGRSTHVVEGDADYPSFWNIFSEKPSANDFNRLSRSRIPQFEMEVGHFSNGRLQKTARWEGNDSSKSYYFVSTDSLYVYTRQVSSGFTSGNTIISQHQFPKYVPTIVVPWEAKYMKFVEQIRSFSGESEGSSSA